MKSNQIGVATVCFIIDTNDSSNDMDMLWDDGVITLNRTHIYNTSIDFIYLK